MAWLSPIRTLSSQSDRMKESVRNRIFVGDNLVNIDLYPSIFSVSMNGCRDIIALSTATSNHELMDEGHVEHV